MVRQTVQQRTKQFHFSTITVQGTRQTQKLMVKLLKILRCT